MDKKKIILGVCGGIAAYKAAILVRSLIKEGAEVQVIMTPDAVAFVTPLTFSTLSGRPVFIEYFDATSGEWNNHVHLALWADAILVAPATANTLAKFAHGLCDNLLAAVYLSATCPVILAPAMDLDMWKHPSTQANISKLESYGNTIISPGEGELASGLVGQGRLREPEEIVAFMTDFWRQDDGLSSFFAGKEVLVTAGPTYEAIDPVRFIGNHSSGKMGLAIADALAAYGASVTLVHGPLSGSPTLRSSIKAIAVTSAQEMLEACLLANDSAEIVIMAAAVADYTPATFATQKIKKKDDDLHIELTKTTDILAMLGERKRPGQVLVGFALETENEEDHALAKLERKNLDYIVLNSLREAGAGFGGDTNKITIFDRQGGKKSFNLKSKSAVAVDILKLLSQ